MLENREIQHLPDDMLRAIKKLEGVSKTMYALYQPKTALSDKPLQSVALVCKIKSNNVYSENVANIQEAFRYQSRFTDYSDRTFNYSAFEYAYWVKAPQYVSHA